MLTLITSLDIILYNIMDTYQKIELSDYVRTGEGGTAVSYTHKTRNALAKLFNPGFEAERARAEFLTACKVFEPVTYDGFKRTVGHGGFNEAVHLVEQFPVAFPDSKSDVETIFSKKGQFYAKSLAGAFGKGHLVRYVDIGQALSHCLDTVGL